MNTKTLNYNLCNIPPPPAWPDDPFTAVSPAYREYEIAYRDLSVASPESARGLRWEVAGCTGECLVV